MINLIAIPDTGDKLKDITSVVERFWQDKADVQEASERELGNFVMSITEIVDRKEQNEV